MTHTVTVLHVPDCSGGRRSLEIARQAAAGLEGVTVEDVVIEEEAQAYAQAFRGSPTVLIDGRDIEANPQTPIGSMG
jgi:hypothetical protein